jgi:uncharacterized membrane protein
MDPVLRVALAFAVFGATHVGLAWPPIRQRLVARLGPWGFVTLFSVVAWITAGVALSTYAANAAEGPAGPGLGAHPAARVLLVGAVALGVMLMTASFAGYTSSPYSPAAGADAREPRGLSRISRHPFFVGTALLGLAHALLATRLVGAVAMGFVGLFSLVGAALQDRKLLALRGEPYARYLAKSSLLPFAAIAAGRQRLVARELPYAALLLGLAIAWLLRGVHDHLFDHGGAYVIAALVVGPLTILAVEWRRDHRERRLSPEIAEG